MLRSEQSGKHRRRELPLARAAGENTQTDMMILALAVRHSAGRPAIRMGGGTLHLWSSFAGCRPNRLWIPSEI